MKKSNYDFRTSEPLETRFIPEIWPNMPVLSTKFDDGIPTQTTKFSNDPPAWTNLKVSDFNPDLLLHQDFDLGKELTLAPTSLQLADRVNSHLDKLTSVSSSN